MFDINKKLSKKNYIAEKVETKETYISQEDFHKDFFNFIFEENNFKKIFGNFEQNAALIDVMKRFTYLPGQDIKSKFEQDKKTKGYYSFLAEILQALILIYKFDLKLETYIFPRATSLKDQRTGIDSFLWDENKKLIVLAEAKFYSVGFKSGAEKIKKDFEEISNNKVDSFISNLRDLSKENKEKLFSINSEKYNDFKLNEIKILTCGFVLHDEINEIYQKIYEDKQVNLEGIKTKLANEGVNNGEVDYLLIHLPIKSKYELIKYFLVEANRRVYG